MNYPHRATDFGAGIGLPATLLCASVSEAAESRNGRRPVKVKAVALATFPIQAAATRFRVAQFIPALAEANVEVTLLPFLTAADFEGLYDRKRIAGTAFRLLLALFRRLAELPRILAADVLFIQREAMLFGPPLIEWLAARVARIPIVLDLDDPTWIPIASPVYGRYATLLKFPAKTNWLTRQAQAVICGSETIAARVRADGVRAVVLPTIVDSAVFTPSADRHLRNGDLPVVGWIGTHGTWAYLQSIFPTLEKVAESVPFRLRIVGSGQQTLTLRGIEVEMLPWRMDREVQDFQSLDVGLYPLPDEEWAQGKSGLKAIQYLACGVPYVASPIGVVREIGIPGVTHLVASTPEEWRAALERLLRDGDERRRMGAAGRGYMLEHYAIGDFARRIGEVLRDAASPARAEAYA
jgi:glycosyltransferase involved in cell wall biosynthesis